MNQVVYALKDWIGSRRKDLFLGVTIPAYYNRRKTAPLRKKRVVFIEYRAEKLSDNFKLLYDYFMARPEYEVRFHSLRHMIARHREYARRCFRMLDDAAVAEYIFLNDANEIISCLELRPETIVVQTWHACGAFKKWGMSTAQKKFGAAAKRQRRHPNYANLTYVTVSSPALVDIYAEAMDLRERKDSVRAVGVSRTDVFFDRERIEGAREELLSLFPGAAGRRVILYAPTFRGRVAQASAPKLPDLEQMSQALGDRYALVICQHPFVASPPTVPEHLKGSFAMDLTGRMDTARLMMASDLCVTDYSSVIFEYALLDRPMLFFAPDLDTYDDWRGFYFPYEEMAPGPVCKTDERLTEELLHIEERFDRQRLADFRAYFMGACDGHATERILRMIGVEDASFSEIKTTNDEQIHS